jgi:FAD/FMN-containing dehydrogenase
MFEDTVAWRGDAGYEEARVGTVFNARRPDRRPAGVARPASDEDVVAAVTLARERGLQVTVRGGGHSWAAWALRDDTLLIDLTRMREIVPMDDDGELVAVSPSVRGGEELAPALNARGRVFPGGHCPSVGLGGFLLQGGQGWNCRTLGWACESVRAIDVVTADGELVHASDDENTDLLWAARGAGPGFFGVVTRFYLRTYPAPRAMTQANQIYPIAALDDVLAWAHEVLPTLDPLVEPVIAATFAPHQAETFAGVSADEPLLIVHTTVMVDDADEAVELLRPLTTCPALDRALLHEPHAPATLAEEYAAQDMMSPRGRRYLADCMWTDAPAAALAPVLEPTFAGLPTRDSFAIWYGWAPHRPQLPDMAFSLEANVYCATYTIWDDAARDAEMLGWLDEQMQRWETVSEGVYLGDSDLYRRPDRFMSDQNFARLEGLRAQRDPDRLFCSYHLPDGATPNRKAPR